jgi:hypothetical protein
MNETTTMMQETQNLMNQAIGCLNSRDPNTALELLIKAKSLRCPIQNLDLSRALCFGQLNRIDEMREALREELRHFSDNLQAKDLLSQVQAEISRTRPAEIRFNDQEFLALLEVIRPFTMLSEDRLYSLFSFAKQICAHNIPGNFVECGVAGGGSSGLLSSVVKKYSKVPRLHFAFDSFSGMPAPTSYDTHGGHEADATGWGAGTCAAPESCVRNLCTELGSVDILRTVKGFFEDTLALNRAQVGEIALLHLDGDWYESTRVILENLYDQIVPGGLLQVDDYGHWEGCKRAIHEFEHKRNLKFSIHPIDGTGVWFQKPN